MLHTSGTIHRMIVMIDLCKVIYLQVFFFHLPGCWEVKRAKNDPESEKLMSVVVSISGTIHHMISHYVAHV